MSQNTNPKGDTRKSTRVLLKGTAWNGLGTTILIREDSYVDVIEQWDSGSLEWLVISYTWSTLRPVTPRPPPTRPSVNWNDPALVARYGTDSDRDIAKDLGVSRERVRGKRLQAGIEAPERKVNPTERDKVLELVSYMSDVDVSASTGFSRKTIANIRTGAGKPPYKFIGPVAIKHGTANSHSYHHCRCKSCVEAHNARISTYYRTKPENYKSNQERYRTKILASAPHSPGKVGWNVLGCRCDGCRLARSEYDKGRRIK